MSASTTDTFAEVGELRARELARVQVHGRDVRRERSDESACGVPGRSPRRARASRGSPRACSARSSRGRELARRPRSATTGRVHSGCFCCALALALHASDVPLPQREAEHGPELEAVVDLARAVLAPEPAPERAARDRPASSRAPRSSSLNWSRSAPRIQCETGALKPRFFRCRTSPRQPAAHEPLQDVLAREVAQLQRGRAAQRGLHQAWREVSGAHLETAGHGAAVDLDQDVVDQPGLDVDVELLVERARVGAPRRSGARRARRERRRRGRPLSSARSRLVQHLAPADVRLLRLPAACSTNCLTLKSSDTLP